MANTKDARWARPQAKGETGDDHKRRAYEAQRRVGDRINPGESGFQEAVVDLFCGAGGLTYGLIQEGLNVVAGVDIDEQCRYAYEHNTGARFLKRDVQELSANALNAMFGTARVKILVGCAPCQPFSVYNQKNNDSQWQLVERFAELIVQVRPDVVSMENVPRLLKYRQGTVFQYFVRLLVEAGYHISYEIVYLPEYGLPQRRSRLVLMASLHGGIVLEAPEKAARLSTVEDAIGKLPPISAGETDPDDYLHTASRLSLLNLKRIRASMPGGSWDDWDEELRAGCHGQESGRGYKSVYGRMRMDEPAPTITTQFYGFGNGRFGHPEQDRAISLREGAILQSFPKEYVFADPRKKLQFKVAGRMIGNAVPIVLARVIGRTIKGHIEANGLSCEFN